ncbi:FAD:protein FMN transferase [Fulvivirga sp. RKSG066]|uniref:FAD:protein FMN transferase n=1 Tax=Fulvivirga aurantia TaxID=2529383 RepID=UPI0012BC1F33|nr:FAD:protein FMN transferase [Fulvivirga aurantia]MTI20351.1 FAD:protein FMN transferase [Fulvivirga aurantia]
MSLRYKNIIYTVVVLLAMYLVYKIRQSNDTLPLVSFSGKTMGPITYSVKYFDEDQRNLQPQVDSLLAVFNQSLNTYIKDSEISTFNRNSSFKFDLPYFYEALAVSDEIYKKTGGAFDPSIGPLINTWGFGYTEGVKKDSAVIDSLKMIVGLNRIDYNQDSVWKSDDRLALDFSASAKGYGVDVVLEYLNDNDIENAFVEIGGEVRASGTNLKTEEPWRVGILNPNSDEINQFPMAVASLKDQAMATSGNYFNYHIIDGVKYSHTISPFTGYPIEHPLLSATVFAKDCMSADALATAFMVMGHEEAISFLNNNTQYEAYLVFSDKQGNLSTYATSGISPYIKEVD